MEQLEWLGLFSEEPTNCDGRTPADAMVDLVQRKLEMPRDGRDMVILVHQMLVEYPDRPREQISSTFVHYGDRGGETAMSRTVGLPAAIAVKLILTNELKLSGSHIPIKPEIYNPILQELAGLGMTFQEKVTVSDTMKK
jgi:saccharopine dehydrogenase-like NADP-dependent oxidoreductase